MRSRYIVYIFYFPNFRLNSETVDAAKLPELESEKKEQEMANLFSSLDVNALEAQPDNNNFVMKPSGPTGQLHDAMGFMPWVLTEIASFCRT